MQTSWCTSSLVVLWQLRDSLGSWRYRCRSQLDRSLPTAWGQLSKVSHHSYYCCRTETSSCWLSARQLDSRRPGSALSLPTVELSQAVLGLDFSLILSRWLYFRLFYEGIKCSPFFIQLDLNLKSCFGHRSYSFSPSRARNVYSRWRVQTILSNAGLHCPSFSHSDKLLLHLLVSYGAYFTNVSAQLYDWLGEAEQILSSGPWGTCQRLWMWFGQALKAWQGTLMPSWDCPCFVSYRRCSSVSRMHDSSPMPSWSCIFTMSALAYSLYSKMRLLCVLASGLGLLSSGQLPIAVDCSYYCGFKPGLLMAQKYSWAMESM